MKQRPVYGMRVRLNGRSTDDYQHLDISIFEVQERTGEPPYMDFQADLHFQRDFKSLNSDGTAPTRKQTVFYDRNRGEWYGGHFDRFGGWGIKSETATAKVVFKLIERAMAYAEKYNLGYRFDAGAMLVAALVGIGCLAWQQRPGSYDWERDYTLDNL